MGTVVLHAGIPKAGSSSIQSWLANNAESLRSQLGIGLMVVRSRNLPGEKHARLRVEEYASGGMNSGRFARAYIGFKRSPRILDSFFAGVTEFADHHRVSVVSSESFAQLFSAGGGDAPFLSRLDGLAREHRVRVAYYIRPQHTCLEAMWRQWGFRRNVPPSVYIAEEAEHLHYLRTQAAVLEAAPHVSFEPRPFRSDLLHGGSPVVDFAHHFLDAGDLPQLAPDLRVNVGLPLELVNLLRFGPKELVGRDPHDNAALVQLQRLFSAVHLPVAPKIVRSRLVLSAYCHARFEAENKTLLMHLGLPPTDFVPPVDEAHWDLAEIDDLWRPDASSAELAVLHAALRALLDETSTEGKAK
jgi:hypothetical protein